LRLSDEENRLIDAWVGYTGEQKAAMLREIIIEQANEAIKKNNIKVKNRA
jgi:predicted DNA-binding protein